MKRILILLCCMMIGNAATVSAASKDLGRGFKDHGVAVPISSHRGTVATIDGAGKNVILSWLMDYRGGYELLMIDAQSGKSQEFPLPFMNHGDSPYASILSTANKFYTHFDSNFVEFDPLKRSFTLCKKTTPQMSMGMTEDDSGVIWSVSYPQSAVCSFNPKTREFRDYGAVYKQNWRQYQRYVAADDAGWIYFALGATSSQIVMFDPKTARATALLPESDRKRGTAYLYRGVDGKVYGESLKGGGEWYELYKGAGRKIGKKPSVKAKAIITDSQALFHTAFPDGSKVKAFNLVDRVLSVEDAGGKNARDVAFDYTSEGANIMGLAAAPDGTISGGTSFPMRCFSFDPKADKMVNRAAYGQFNTIAPQGDKFFIGGYGGGFLLEWDPAKPWINTVKGNAKCNPIFLRDCDPDIHRPHRLLALDDGKTIIMSGTPQYGYTGGGLLFWDRPTRKNVLISDTDIVPNQSSMSLVVLPDGKLLGGTTTSPGTGGEKKATQAELYIMDMSSKRIEWHEVVFPGAQEYTDMHAGPNGLVYGFVDRRIFFVFDPAKHAVVHQQNTEREFGATAYEQCPRVFVPGTDDAMYVLFNKGIARVNARDYSITLLANSPIPVQAGGDYLGGRIYFINASHICSYQLPK